MTTWNVATIQALQAVVPNAGDDAIVSGYFNAGDLGGGSFYWEGAAELPASAKIVGTAAVSSSISGVTNTSPIQITASTGPGIAFSSGQSVLISGVSSEANGVWTIRVTQVTGASTSFTLDESNGTTADKYSGGGTVDTTTVKISSKHNLVSGQRILIGGVVGTTSVNGAWRCTVLSTTIFSIPALWNKPWSSGGAVGDGGTSIPSTAETGASSGRWRRIYAEGLSVRWFGAGVGAENSGAILAAANVSGSSVSSVTVVACGTGYSSSPLPTVTFSPPSGLGGTTAQGAAVVSNGAVVSVTVTDPGSGYASPPTVSFDGAGSGASAAANMPASSSLRFPAGTYDIKQSMTLPSWVSTEFPEGAVLRPSQVLVTLSGPIVASPAQQIIAGGSVWAMTQTGSGSAPAVGLYSTGPAWTATSLSVAVDSSSQFSYVLNGGPTVSGNVIPGGSYFAIPGTALLLIFPSGAYTSPVTYTWAPSNTINAAKPDQPSIAVTAGNLTAPTLEYEMQLQIATTGGLGSGSFELSLDGGPFSAPTTIPVSGTYSLAFTGVDITFSNAVYSAGSQYTWTTTGPVAFGAGSQAARTLSPNHLGAGQPKVDLGNVINACDAALGSVPGEIVVDCNGGNLAKNVIVGSNHRLRLGPGTYSASQGQTIANYAGIPWLLSNNSTLEGAGAQTILQESSGTGPGGPQTITTVVTSALFGQSDYFGGAANIEIRNLQITGLPTNQTSDAQSAIHLGNCNHGVVDNVVIANVNSFGITFGGGGSRAPQWTPGTLYPTGVVNSVVPPQWKGSAPYAPNQCVTPPAWQASTAYSSSSGSFYGAVVVPTTAPYNGYPFGFMYACIAAGVSAATEPAWNPVIGSVTLDGSAGTTGALPPVQWVNLGPVHYYQCTSSTTGTTGSSPPAFPVAGFTVTDGTVQWKDAGPQCYFVTFAPGVTNNASPANAPVLPTAVGATSADGSILWRNAGLGCGPRATDIHVTHCSLINMLSQGINGINADDFHISGNHFIGLSQRVSTAPTLIDCEPNVPTDLDRFFSICDNIIDIRQGIPPASPTGAVGITVKGVFSPNACGLGIVSGNVIVGAEIAGYFPAGLAVGSQGPDLEGGIGLFSVSNTVVSNNTIINARQTGIAVYSDGFVGGAQYNTIKGNILCGCGWAPTGALILGGVCYTRVLDNVIHYGGEVTAAAVSSSIAELGLYYGPPPDESPFPSVTVTPGNPTTVTTPSPHGFPTSGPAVYASVAGICGTIVTPGQPNALVGPVTVMSPTTFTIPVNTTGLVLATIASMDDSGGLIEVETVPEHGLTTGQAVFIFGAPAASNANNDVQANAQWVVTVTSPSKFTLNGSSWTGTGGTGYFGQLQLACGGNYIANNYLECVGASNPPNVQTQGYATLVNNFLGGYPQSGAVVGGVLQSSQAGTTLSRRVVSGRNYTIALNDHLVEVNASNGPVSVILPPAASPVASTVIGAAPVNQAYVIKRTDNSTNGVTVSPSGSDMLDGSPNALPVAPYGSVRVYSDGGATASPKGIGWWTW